MSLIERALEEEAASDATWLDVFTQGKSRFFQRLVLAVLSICMLQISGVNLITYYAYVSSSQTEFEIQITH